MPRVGSRQDSPDDDDEAKPQVSAKKKDYQKLEDSTHDAYKNSDAYKNTMEHFERLDKEKGAEKGHHYQKMKEDREAKMKEDAKRKKERDAKNKAEWDAKYQEMREAKMKEESEARRSDAQRPSGYKRIPREGDGIDERGEFEPGIRKYGQRNSGKEREKILYRPPPPPPPRESIPIGGPAIELDPVRAKKFQEYMARRKKSLELREKMKHPIKTALGKGESDMGSVHKKQSPMNNSKAQYDKKEFAAGEKKKPDLRPQAQQKKGVGEKVLKNIPIVKRAFKRSKGEETMNDAALSFTRGLLMGAFKTNEPLDYKRKAALLDWFDLLRVSLPPEIGLHELIDNLKYNVDSVSQSRDELLKVINKHPLPEHLWSNDCTKGTRSGGFFCGFWKLLHVTSVGFAEQAGGLSLKESSPSIRVFSAMEAAAVVREYMMYFFNCEKCSKRFVAQYDDCSFERCNRLSDETVDAPVDSFVEFPLWLWEVHNDISRSKLNRALEFHEKEGKKEQAKKFAEDMQALYPHIDKCTKCVTSSGLWNLKSVYNYLENEYW